MAIVARKTIGRVRYRVLVRDWDGNWFKTCTFDTKSDAKAHEAELLVKREKGVKAASFSARGITLLGYYEDKWKRIGRAKVGDGWASSQDQMFKDHISPALGGQALIEIAHTDIADLLVDLKRKGLGDQTRLHIYNLLHKIFRDAVEVDQLREGSPVYSVFKPKVTEGAPKFLPPEQALDFLDAVADDPWGPAVWVMVHCGIRSAEIQALRIKDLDLRTGHFTLREQYRRKEKRLAALKNGTWHRYRMPVELVEYLRERIPKRANPEDFFITGKRSGTMVSHGMIWKNIRRLCALAKVPMLSAHPLRHTSTEIWVARGATREDIRRLLNQDSEKTVDRYMHKTDSRQDGLADTRVRRKGQPAIRRVK